MWAAILHAVGGDPTVDGDGTLSSALEARPYADVNATQYLDGHTVYHGRLAGYVPDEQPNFYTNADPDNWSLEVDTEDTETPVVTDVVADLEAGWCGVDAAAGADLLETVLLDQVSCIPEAAELDLAGIAESLPTSVHIKGVVTSEDTADDDDRDAAKAVWHDEAPRSAGGIPARGLSQIAIEYRWDGHRIDATVAASGYVAIYSDVGVEVAARWITEVVWPQSVHEDGTVEAQTELPSEECADCGRESDDLERHAEAPVEGVLCPVCRDQYDEAAGGMSA